MNEEKYVEMLEDGELYDYITNLQQENERLKQNAIHNDKVVDKAKWNEMIYKSRIEKAVQYIKQLEHSEWITFGRKILLDILNGRSDE